LTRRIAAIVEGHGEMRALPVLLRRIVAESADASVAVDPAPWRIPRGTLLGSNEQELCRALDVLASPARSGGGTLILFDGDDDCPATLAPRFAQRVRRLRPDLAIGTVIAHREYEAWFLAAAASCAGHCGLAKDIADHPAPEAVADCKKWLTERMPRTSPYKETLHQAKLSAVFDWQRARRTAPSLDKLCREMERLIRGGASLSE
jgi:Domain of unknown function (DUF4276)